MDGSSQNSRRSVHVVIKSFFSYFIKICIAPKGETEDGRRREFILNTLIVVTLLLLSILILRVFRDILFFKEIYRGISLFLIMGIFGLFISLLIISRKGYWRVATGGILFLYALATFYTASVWGFDVPSVILGYVLIIAISSILVNIRFGLISTICLCVSIILIGYYQIYNHQPLNEWRLEPPRLSDTINYAAVLAFIAFLYWLSNRDIEKSLIRARNSEAQLKEERDLLEIKVEERTREIKMLQMERMSELYKFAEFGKISSGAFHDLINPLTSIHLLIHDIHKDDHPRIPEIQDHLTRAVSVSKRMHDFIAALRKKISQGNIHAAFSPRKELDEAAILLSYKIKSSGCTLSIAEQNVIEIFGNPITFYQIATNLISNAVDAYEGIDRPDKRIEITLKDESDHFSMEVKDFGAGISKENFAHLFKPFFTTKPIGKGTGLGLSSTKHIIEKEFGGTFTLQSEEGKGTSCLVRIPLA